MTRTNRADGLLIGLSAALGILLLTYPSIPAIAVALWWNANTIAHNFIHRPFFRTSKGNRVYAFYLTLLLGFPQSGWRDRHLAHHAGQPFRARLGGPAMMETLLLAGLWLALLARGDGFLWMVYLPGCIAGLGFCWLHGYFEHAGGTISHYGLVYNTLFLNDGYHVEHHRRPNAHWTELPALRGSHARASRWPAILRWIEFADREALDALERIVLRSPSLQRFLLRTHEPAVRALAPCMEPIRSVTIVGGGLFPRTAMLLKRVLPGARLTVVDANPDSIARAQRLVAGLEWEARSFDGTWEEGADLVVIPLSFRGDRRAIYRDPPAPNVLVHDWIWAKRHESRASAIVSVWLLKRVNLVQRERS